MRKKLNHYVKYWKSLAGIFAMFATGSAGLAAVDPEPGVSRATLSNGLQVIIVQNPLAPVAAVMFNYKVGSDEAPGGFPGTAHALEHMMFRGSPGLSAGQLADLSAELGGDSNADTQQAITQYFFTVPAEDLEVALRIEAIRMRALLKSEKLWDQERGAIEQEVAQDLSNPEYLFYMRLLEALFKGTPYEHDALGTRPSFDKTTDAMLRKFHDTWYVPNNAVLIIVGDVPVAPTLDKIQRLLAGIPPGKLPPRPEFHFEPVKPQTLRFETDMPQGMAVLAFRFPGADSPDFAAAQILGDVLSSERGKLYALVPEGKALSASFSYDALPRAGIGYAAGNFPAEADAEALLNRMRAIVAAEVTKGVMADLVEAAKRLEVANAEFQRNSVLGLAMEWSQAVAVEGRQSPDEDVAAIERVTVADVNRVARKYLVRDEAVAAILTPQPSGKPVAPKGFGGSESFTPTHAKAVKLPAWAETVVNRLEVPPSTLHPVVTNLPNGLRVIVQPESISDGVTVLGGVKSNPNLQTPAGKEGLSMVLEQLFSYGTKSLDRLAFQKALDDIGALESAGTNFTLQVLSAQFERGVQLLADNELSPALPEEAFKTLQPELAAGVAGEIQSPSFLVGRALRADLFPPHDPVQPPPEWLEKVKQREPGMPARRAKLVALIEHLDWGIGKVLDTLDRTGLAANTLVIFNSDNGGVLANGANNGPWRGGKHHMYEGGLRVPGAARWPARIQAGTRTERLTLTMDIFATACAAAGVAAPKEIDGTSFLPLLLGQAGSPSKRDLYWVCREGGPAYGGKTIDAFRRDDWKLLQDSPFAKLELYDLKSDPLEATNLAASARGLFNQLSAGLRNQIQRAGQVPWQPPERPAVPETSVGK